MHTTFDGRTFEFQLGVSLYDEAYGTFYGNTVGARAPALLPLLAWLRVGPQVRHAHTHLHHGLGPVFPLLLLSLGLLLWRWL